MIKGTGLKAKASWHHFEGSMAPGARIRTKELSRRITGSVLFGRRINLVLDGI